MERHWGGSDGKNRLVRITALGRGVRKDTVEGFEHQIQKCRYFMKWTVSSHRMEVVPKIPWKVECGWLWVTQFGRERLEGDQLGASMRKEKGWPSGMPSVKEGGEGL